jgi:hypothetical protein
VVEKRREVKNGKAEERMYKRAQSGKGNKKTSSSESFTIRGSCEGISDAPTMEMKGGLRESSKGWTGGPGKKTKGMVVITSVQTESR